MHAKFQPAFEAEILNSGLHIWCFFPFLVPVRQPTKCGLILFFWKKKCLLKKFLLPIFVLVAFVLAQAILELSSISSSIWDGSDFCLPLYKRIPSLPDYKVGAGKEGKGAKGARHLNFFIKIDHQGPKTNKKKQEEHVSTVQCSCWGAGTLTKPRERRPQL